MPDGSASGGFASNGDRLGRLWTPYRMAYIKREDSPVCPFCRAPDLDPDEGLVIARGRLVYALLNRYPYNTGHLMICPYRHVADYTDLSVAETVELNRFAQTAMRALREVSRPDGFNLGMNLGRVAGAGIAEHLHLHVLPRWGGDTNFMPLIAGTKVLPQLLADTRRLLAEAWETALAKRAKPAATKPAATKPAATKPAPKAARAKPGPQSKA